MEIKLELLDNWLEFLQFENIKNENDIRYLMNKLEQNDEAFKKKHIFKKMFSFKSYLMTQNNYNYLLNRFFTVQINLKQEYRIIFSFRSFLYDIESIILKQNENHVDQLLDEESYYQVRTIYSMLNNLLKQILSEKKEDYSKENLKLFIIFERARPQLLQTLNGLQGNTHSKPIFLRWTNLDKRKMLSDYFNDKNSYSSKDYQLCLSFKKATDILLCALGENLEYPIYKKMSQLYYNIKKMPDVAISLLGQHPNELHQHINENTSFFDEFNLIKMKKRLLQQMREQSLRKQDDEKRQSIQEILAIDLELKRVTQG